MPAPRDEHENASPLGRMLRNTAWLIGGKGFGAVCSLIYLAILTRTLGLKGFGHFSLILGTAQALIAIAGFQTWRVVVRYGASHIHNGDWDKFGRLGMLAGLLDVIGAICGCGIAALAFYGFAHALQLNPGYIDVGFWFSCAMLWALVSAPTGIVRALHRFDMSVYVEAIVPTGRLAVALLVWFTGPTVGRFLLGWALVDLIEAACYWGMARYLSPQSVRLRHVKDWRLALRENPGLGRFFWVTYAGGTLDAIAKNGPLLAVGAFVGTRSAGLYRLASQLSQALSKFSAMLTRAVYSEIAHMRVASEAAEFRRLALQTSIIAGGGGLLVVAIAILGGKQLLALIGGEDFERGAVILVPLAIAASFDLASVAFEPVLHSTGRASLSLLARVFAIVALLIGLYTYIDHGPSGVAWAVVQGSAVSYLAMGIMAWRTLRKEKRAEMAAISAAPNSGDDPLTASLADPLADPRANGEPRSTEL